MASVRSGVPISAPRFDDRLKASLAAASNLLFLLAVVALSMLEKPLFDHRQLHGGSLLIYTVGTLVLVVYYGLLVTSDRLNVGIDLLMKAARQGIADHGNGVADAGALGAGRFRRIVTNLWTPVTLNFGLVGWLIYATGGITNSPYSQVPLAMILIGQSTYDVPAIKLGSGARMPRLLIFASNVARLYWSSLFVVISLLTGLVLVQKYLPLVTTPAPTTEFFLMMLVSLFASMCVTFVTRRADQASASRAS